MKDVHSRVSVSGPREEKTPTAPTHASCATHMITAAAPQSRPPIIAPLTGYARPLSACHQKVITRHSDRNNAVRCSVQVAPSASNRLAHEDDRHHARRRRAHRSVGGEAIHDVVHVRKGEEGEARTDGDAVCARAPENATHRAAPPSSSFSTIGVGGRGAELTREQRLREMRRD